MFQPFDYQYDCLRSIERVRWQNKKTALVVMASGLGKTVTVAFDVKRWLKTNPKSKILYLCHQNEILSQARAKFQLVIGGSDRLYGCYHGAEKSRQSQFLFASFQTMREKFQRFDRKEFDYTVVDESHHVPAATYFPVVRYFKPKFLLGITATPDRIDMQDIRTLFGTEVYSLDLPDALSRGLLTKVDYRLLTDEIVELGKIENPYKMSLAELNKKIFVPKRDKEIIEVVKRKIASVKNPRAMIFCPSIRYTEELRKHIPDAVPVHSGLSKRLQEARIQNFRDGSINTILTVDKFNEGIDIPEVNVVVFLRSTQSRTVFYQQLGRGLRKTPEKSKVLVLDFIANCERLLMVNEFAEFAKNASRKRPKLGKYAPKEMLVVNGGSFTFTEKVKNVLDVLEKVKTGYTPKVLIEQLQNEAKLLGRTPTQKDLDKASQAGRTASMKVYRRVFGSLTKTINAAKLPIEFNINVTNNYTKKDLIKQLWKETKKLGRPPFTTDMVRASREGRMASTHTFYRVFGNNIKNAWKAARLPSLIMSRRIELIKQLRVEAGLLKRVPSTLDILEASQAGRTANYQTFLNYFPTRSRRKWNYILKKAKLI